ncbi:ComF family protein [Pararobbsia silviterrae]|uniref:ComF family protein n=1 Tax=Pararobbsia silviterrae TaxID=1792498 RepID=A0A494Y9J7_9BURK|nr:ComF family protein [Pararobbsia silviterrae]RKP58795.1 ComF family protein [Pararobbsia silviterrae]
MKRALHAARRAGSSFLGAACASTLHTLLPSACALCGATSRALLCAGCAACLADTQTRCTRCALPIARRADAPCASLAAEPNVSVASVESVERYATTLCGHCIARLPAFDATVCVADYAEPADTLAIGLKFRAQLSLAGCFASCLAARIRSACAAPPDLIVAVPLSDARLAARGYNQAWEIARRLARAIDRPAIARGLARTRDTPAQSGLRGVDRWRNMRRAFVAHRPERMRGAHIGLVDDVMTSGATLDAAARALKRAGAARVTALVVLRTPTPDSDGP